MFTLVPVILAGGESQRLWPISSAGAPKQFMNLGKDGETLFAASYKRALSVAPSRNIVIVTKQDFGQQVWDEVKKHDRKSKAQAILEPCARNTAAAVAMAAIHALNHFENPVLWVMPSDHYIEKPYQLINAVQESANAACNNNMVSFGILPGRTDVACGHMICDKELYDSNNLFKVKLFIDNPTGARLKWFAAQSNCLLNTGMYLFSAASVLKHLKTCSKKLVNVAGSAYRDAREVKHGLLLDDEYYQDMPLLSIDKLMEGSNLVVRPVNVGLTGVRTIEDLVFVSKKNFIQPVKPKISYHIGHAVTKTIPKKKNISPRRTAA